MITLPMDVLLVIPLATVLVLLLAAAGYYAFSTELPKRSWVRPFIYRCSSCGRVYLDARQVPMAGCPRCGNLNPAIRR